MDDAKVLGLSAAEADDTTPDAVKALCRQYGSPLLPLVDTLYPIIVGMGCSVAFAFAMGEHESKLVTDGTAVETLSLGNTRQAYKSVGGEPDPTKPIYFGAIPIVSRQTIKNNLGESVTGDFPVLVKGRSGSFPKWKSLADGVRSTVARLMAQDWMYFGKGLTTVREIIPVWAPKTDQNDPIHYGDQVLARMAKLRAAKGVKVMGHVPKPPINVRIIGVAPNGPKVLGVGVEWSNVKRSPLFSVVHGMIGSLWGTDSHFRKPDTAGLTDYGIGRVPLRGGFAEIIQWCDITGNLVPWASGTIIGKQYGDGKRVVDKWGVGAVNRNGVSIELDDAGSTTSVIAAPTWASLCWMLAWVHAELLGQTADTFDWNCHHREFTGGDGSNGIKNCPEAHVYNFTTQYQDRVKDIMRHYQNGTPYPARTIAGLAVAVPTGSDGFGADQVVPTPTPIPSDAPRAEGPYKNPDGSPVLLGGLFRRQWEANPDRLRDYGFPILNESTEILQDGKTYTVQYFERERFQLNSPTEVGYGLIGLELAQTKGLR
jgi:hypothetical protein